MDKEIKDDASQTQDTSPEEKEDIVNKTVEEVSDEKAELIDGDLKQNEEDVSKDEQEPESKESFLTKLRDKFIGEKPEAEETETEETEDELEEDIDATFIEAAQQAGWKEDKIIEFAASYNNAELKGMAAFLETPEEEAEAEEEKHTEVDNKTAAEEIEPDKLDELLKPYVEKIAAANKERQDELESRLAEFVAEKQAEERRQTADRVNEFFDNAAKDFPVFGKTEELPTFPEGTPQAGEPIPYGPAYEARSAVFGMAAKLNNTGMSVQESLDEAMSWYRGKNMQKEVHNKMVRDLKRNESRLSAKRTQKNTAKVYSDPSEERRAVVLEAARKAGMQV